MGNRILPEGTKPSGLVSKGNTTIKVGYMKSLILFASFVLTGFLTAHSQQVRTWQMPGEGDGSRIETRVINMTPESQSYLGVSLVEIGKDNFSKFGLNEIRGVAVESVGDNSPAAKAGIQKGDVIVRFDGESVTSARKLQRMVSEVAPDHSAKVGVVRNGKETEISVTIGLREADPRVGGMNLEGMPELPGEFNMLIPRGGQMLPGGPNRPQRQVTVTIGGRQIGVVVTPVGKQLGQYFGVTDGKGLLVSEVRDGSPAAKAGIKAGDVIVDADGKALGDNQELIQAVNAKTEGDISLTVIRNKKRETIKVTPEASKQEIVEERLVGPIGG
jgi:membrane-associated protease RseP (regulator of RpoE activity)